MTMLSEYDQEAPDAWAWDHADFCWAAFWSLLFAISAALLDTFWFTGRYSTLVADTVATSSLGPLAFAVRKLTLVCYPAAIAVELALTGPLLVLGFKKCRLVFFGTEEFVNGGSYSGRFAMGVMLAVPFVAGWVASVMVVWWCVRKLFRLGYEKTGGDERYTRSGKLPKAPPVVRYR